MSYYTVQQTTKREAAKGTCRSCFNPLFRQSFSPRGPVQWKQTAAALKMSLQDIHWITAVVNVHGQTELHWCSYYCTDITHSCSWSGSFCFIFTDNFTNSLNVRHGYNVKNWKDQCYCHEESWTLTLTEFVKCCSGYFCDESSMSNMKNSGRPANPWQAHHYSGFSPFVKNVSVC